MAIAAHSVSGPVYVSAGSPLARPEHYFFVDSVGETWADCSEDVGWETLESHIQDRLTRPAPGLPHEVWATRSFGSGECWLRLGVVAPDAASPAEYKKRFPPNVQVGRLYGSYDYAKFTITIPAGCTTTVSQATAEALDQFAALPSAQWERLKFGNLLEHYVNQDHRAATDEQPKRVVGGTAVIELYVPIYEPEPEVATALEAECFVVDDAIVAMDALEAAPPNAACGSVAEHEQLCDGLQAARDVVVALEATPPTVARGSSDEHAPQPVRPQPRSPDGR